MADNEVVDYDSLSDEEFLNALEEAGSVRPEDEEENATEDGNVEDTNQPEDSEEEIDTEAETNDLIDDEDLDTEETSGSELEEEEEGNAQEEIDSEEGESDEEEPEDETETKDESDETDQETEEVNYEKQYKELMEQNKKLKEFEDFYNQVTSEFVANGKKVKGFTDPRKIIESQQMAAGFSDKMAGFSKYKPFMNAIKDHGFLDNPEKFNLAMNLIDGDKEAIKKHIKDLEIDPFEFDMENINYEGKNQVASNIEIAYDEVLENAKANNVDNRVQQVIGKEWDDQSVIALLEDPQSSADLITHLSTGAYDVVQDRIYEKKRTDVNGVFSKKPMIEQYREAAAEIEYEYLTAMQNQQLEPEGQQIDEEAVQAEMKRIEKERMSKEYVSKVEKQNAKANEARKKATSLSRKKPRTKTKKVVFDPTNASDEEFTKYLDSIMYSQ